MQNIIREWNADDYAKNSSAQLEWATELVAKLALKGSESLIGCGDGKITAQIAQMLRHGHVLGTDASGEMIRFAAEHHTAAHPNLSFAEMNAERIRCSQNFDIAFSNATLHWVPNHLAVLQGLRHCLMPHGRLLFQMGGRGNAAGVFAAIEQAIAQHGWQQYFNNFVPPYSFFGPEEYEEWLPQSGFQLLRAELINKDMRHAGAEGLKGWIRTTWFPFTDRMPAALKETFLDAVVNCYLSIDPVDLQGATHVNMVRLEIEAVLA